MRILRGCLKIIGLSIFAFIAISVLLVLVATNSITNPPPTPTISPISSPTSVFRQISNSAYYLNRRANVRSCANTTCDKLGLVDFGTRVTVSGETYGEAVTSGNSKWYQIEYGGKQAFVYSAYLADTMPVPTQQPAQPVADHPSGATALCNDRTYSYAANHQGACSHHDGVAVFYK